MGGSPGLALLAARFRQVALRDEQFLLPGEHVGFVSQAVHRPDLEQEFHAAAAPAPAGGREKDLLTSAVPIGLAALRSIFFFWKAKKPTTMAAASGMIKAELPRKIQLNEAAMNVGDSWGDDAAWFRAAGRRAIPFRSCTL